ncbi:MAG: DUF1638 domain-containing protein [Pseudomonadota bacterium]
MTDESTLTTEGLAPSGCGKALIIACGALAREIIAIKAAAGLNHLDLTCLPAILHNHPERIPGAVHDTVAKYRASYDHIFIAYADCGTGGQLQSVCAELGVEMIEGPHCYSFFEGNEAFSARDEIDAFYLTDFLVRQFDAFVIRPLGLDRHPELRDAYFGHYKTLVYQAQTDDPALTEKAQECADRLGLAFERRFTGYGDLDPALSRL